MADENDISPHHGWDDHREQNEFYTQRMKEALLEANIVVTAAEMNAVKHAAVSAIVADVKGQNTAWGAGHDLEIYTMYSDDYQKDLLNNFLGREIQKHIPTWLLQNTTKRWLSLLKADICIFHQELLKKNTTIFFFNEL
ncbi:hypothetical protein [Roseibium sp. Sym1]|uniref:hypothetical protein n=1 Tax=Roseibium sp. Sym1 TaxID=3016006 RepID=UPI0022B414EB|nr:hypothetical protein [Roseibium sp. Sym1]